MSNASITIIGSLGGDPELRYTPSGAAVVNLSVAATERIKDGDAWKDGVTTWYRVNVWREYAENIAESLRKGDQVFVTGRVKNRPYEKDGQQRLALEVDADEVGPTLRFAVAKVSKAGKGGGNKGGGKAQASDDPWAAAGSGNAAKSNDPWG